MELSPEKREPTVLSQQDIDAKYIELDMRRIFNDTTVSECRLQITESASETLNPHNAARTGMTGNGRGFQRISEAINILAIIRWRQTHNEDESHVVQFEAPDGAPSILRPVSTPCTPGL